LLEVVLAMGVLLLGLSVILGLLSFGASLARTAAMRTAASQAVEAVMADLEESLFPLDKSGEAGEPEPVKEKALVGDAQIVYSANATLIPGQEANSGAPEYRVDVELGWLSSGVRKTAHFETILLREVPFGVRQRARTADQP
jgi:hypothetical protein